MKMDVTELGPMKRALKIEVPADEVTQRFARAYVELNRQVNIPGFRPGKAPLALLEKRYAKAVEEDVIRSLVPDYYDKAVRQAGIVPVLVEIPPLDRVKIKKDEPFTFTATVEIKCTEGKWRITFVSKLITAETPGRTAACHAGTPS